MEELLLKAVQLYARRFPLPHGKQRAVTFLVDHLFKQLPRSETVLKINGIRILCDPKFYIQRQLFFFGEYEAEASRLWADLCSEAKVIFDIGANIGLYSLLAASQNQEAAIHAFEPTPSLAEMLITNAILNGFTNIVINKVAVNDLSGTLHLNYCSGSGGVNEGMNYTSAGRESLESITVPAISLDEYCIDNSIEYIDLMKVDVEGNEISVLRGAKRLISSSSIGFIFLELIDWAAARHDCTTRDVMTLLTEHGYNIYYLKNGGLAALPEGVNSYNGDVVAIAANRLSLISRV